MCETAKHRPNLRGDVRAAGRAVAAEYESFVDGRLFSNPEATLEIAELIVEINPNEIDRTSASYASGAAEALASVLMGLKERGLTRQAGSNPRPFGEEAGGE
jgi:hypothetical protein